LVIFEFFKGLQMVLAEELAVGRTSKSSSCSLRLHI
jgi:hypothetical protein